MTSSMGYEGTSYARRGKTVLGFPLEGFGLLSSMLLTLATGFFTFFLHHMRFHLCAAHLECDRQAHGELCGHVSLCWFSPGSHRAGGVVFCLRHVVGAGQDSELRRAAAGVREQGNEGTREQEKL